MFQRWCPSPVIDVHLEVVERLVRSHFQVESESPGHCDTIVLDAVVPGVGAITAISFATAIEYSDSFKKIGVDMIAQQTAWNLCEPRRPQPPFEAASEAVRSTAECL